MPAKIFYQYSEKPLVSVIIPSLDGKRNGNVDILINSLENQTIKNIEIILSINESPNGHARNVGTSVCAKSSEYFFFFDDDVTLGHDRILEFMIKTFKKDNNIGLVGASQCLPPKSDLWSQWLSYDIARNKFPIVTKITDTDMVTHAGLGCRKKLWFKMNGESDVLVTGTDTDLRERLREKGYRTVVAPYSYVFHPVDKNLFVIFKRAIIHGKHQVEYRLLHGYHKKWMHPFHKVTNMYILFLQIIREMVFFLPHIFYANRNVKFGLRPFNAVFRFIMVTAYSFKCYRKYNNQA